MLLRGYKNEYVWISWVLSTSRGAIRLKAKFKLQNLNLLLNIFHSEPTEKRQGKILLQDKQPHRKGEKVCLQQPMWSGCVYTAFCAAQGCSGQDLWCSTESAAADMTRKVGIHVHLPSQNQPKGAWNMMQFLISGWHAKVALRRLLQSGWTPLLAVWPARKEKEPS